MVEDRGAGGTADAGQVSRLVGPAWDRVTDVGERRRSARPAGRAGRARRRLPAAAGGGRSRSRSARWCACAICRSAGASTLLWRKRRFGCERCGRTFTETHPALPPRQRVSARFRARLFERSRGGAAHAEVAREEQTTRYQVARAFGRRVDELRPAARDRRRGGCRSMRPITAAAASSRPSCPTSTAAASSTCSTAAAGGASSATCARCTDDARAAIEVVSIDPYDAYRQAIRAELPHARIVCDHFHLVRGANTALDSVRRERQRQSGARRPKGTRRSGQPGALATRALPRPSPAAQGARAAHRTRPATPGRVVRARATDRRGLGTQGGVPRRSTAPATAAGRAAPETLPAAVERAGIPAFDAFAKGIRSGATSCWPTSTSRPPTATPKASSTRSR